MKPNELVKYWIGDEFRYLHPLLQQLHIKGDKLAGDVDISHDNEGLHWSRCFNGEALVESVFKPVGNSQQGYWVETTGPLTMKLTVDIINGGWYWRCLKINFFGLPIPLWLTPKANAYKVIENGQYCFYVEFSLPAIGYLVCYQGLLQAENIE